MSNTLGIKNNKNTQALLAELEKRYGLAVAQEIITQIKMAWAEDTAPDYMPVKACSEVLELFRGEAQEIVTRLRLCRKGQADYGMNVTPMDKPALESQFRRIYRLYWVSMKLFYPLYNKAITAPPKPSYLSQRISPFTSPKAAGTPLCRSLAA